MDRKRQKLTLEKNGVQKECQEEKVTALERKLEHMENKLKLVSAELEQVKEERAHDKINFETEKCEYESRIDKYKEQYAELQSKNEKLLNEIEKLQSENEKLQKYLQDLESANINVEEKNQITLTHNTDLNSQITKIIENRCPETLGVNSPPGIPRNFPYGPTPMTTSNPLYPSGVGFAPNMSASPYPSTAFTSGNPSNSSYPTASSSYLLVPNNAYSVFSSPYPASFDNPYPASTSHSSASSDSPYPASTSAFPTSSNSFYPASCNIPRPAPTSAYPSCSNRHYSASVSSYFATSYAAPASTNQPPGPSPYPSVGSRAYESEFRPSAMGSNNAAFNINSFPEEVLIKIFGFLTQNQLGQIARVCKEWNILTKSPVLWKKVNIEFSPSHGSQSIVAESFVNMLPPCVTAIRLDFIYSDDWTKPLNFEELSVRLQEKCPHLKMLNLNYAILSDTLPSIIDFCSLFLQNMQVLVLHCSLFPDYPARREVGNTSKIEVLDVSCCHLGHFNKPPFLRMSNLKQLHLSYTNVNDSWFENDASFLNQLQVLDLGSTKINSGTLQAIQNHALNLRELYLCYADLDDELNFKHSVFPHLTTICLRGCKVTCDGIVSLLQSCQSLQNVYITQCVAQSYAIHPSISFNKCKLEIVKVIRCGDHRIKDYL